MTGRQILSDDKLKEMITDFILDGASTEALAIAENLPEGDFTDDEIDDAVQRGCKLWDDAIVEVWWDE